MFIFDYSFFQVLMAVMAVLAVIVFIALQYVAAPYGIMISDKWGATINNKTGWIIMEAPAFITMLLLWVISPRAAWIAPAVMASLFLLHYFQRSFIFPLLLKGRNRMPWAIVLMGLIFNIINAYLLGAWLFFFSPATLYTAKWLSSPLFILGTIVFFIGMWINLRSDYIIRHLRKPGDTRHYIPRGGMFRYVSCANYLGEITEWIGFAILTWSLPGLLFAVWTFANLGPRARRVHKRYLDEFGEEYSALHRKAIIPFLY